MSKPVPPSDLETAIADISEKFGGVVPNFFRVLARNSAVLVGFHQMMAALERGILTPAEREIVALVSARRTSCTYCQTSHTQSALNHGLPHETVDAIYCARPPAEPRHALIVEAADLLNATHGALNAEQKADFELRGLSDSELLEIIAVLSAHLLANYVTNLTNIPIDPQFRRAEPPS